MDWSQKVREFLDFLGWRVRDAALYEQALTHSSYAHEKGRNRRHNERLEFLGDAVLELIISDYLFVNFPSLPEGKLTKLRADLVCESSLAHLAFALNLSDKLRLGRGELLSGGYSRPSLLSDALEALIGAAYLDQGLETCRRQVCDLYGSILNDLEQGVLRHDYKTLLQEYSQSRYAVTPVYRIIAESGPDHEKEFEASVALQSEKVGRGRGRSKKEAEQAAARDAWSKLTP